jgi:hypothetical protein
MVKYIFKSNILKLGLVVHAYNPSTRNVEAGRFQAVGQPGLLCESLSRKINNNKLKKKNSHLKLNILYSYTDILRFFKAWKIS